MSTPCTQTHESVNNDIEDIIIPPFRNFDSSEVETIEKVIYELIKTPIKTHVEMQKFINLQQKTAHIVLAPMKVLYVYKTMIQQNKIKRHKEYEKFMVTKKVRGLSGVMVVTVATSPWPSSAEDSYIDAVHNNEYLKNVDRNVREQLLEKNSTTIDLAKKNKNFSCKYDCFYCPSEPGQPRSYLLKEPGIARANQHRFDPVDQFNDRGNSYLTTGHVFDKIELIILGGTWSSYPKDYQESFIRDLYYAANTFYSSHNVDDMERVRPRLSVDEEILLNESSTCRIIGLTLETRPDEVTYEELVRFRRFGVTRVQIGVQHTDNDILKYINRGCTIEQVKAAILLLKNNCFKVDIHLMPDLPSSNVEKDFQMFKTVLEDPMLQADQWKVYPCAVVPWTKIKLWNDLYKEDYDHELNEKGLSKVDNRRYSPYADETIPDIKIKIGKKREIPSSPLIELLIKVKGMVHPWIRINRIIRDIPSLYITSGNDKEDLRSILESEIKSRNAEPCKCIRCREVKDTKVLDTPELVVRRYNASHGVEYFLSYETNNRATILAFLRLRLPNTDRKIDTVVPENIFPELLNTALIRELHVYGVVVPVKKDSVSNDDNNNTNDNDANQHMGYGKKLMKEAERIAQLYDYKRVAVIAGVGVRNYYRKLGYLDQKDSIGNFQIKQLVNSNTNYHHHEDDDDNDDKVDYKISNTVKNELTQKPLVFDIAALMFSIIVYALYVWYIFLRIFNH